jgi:HPt (histidine-containing phosphotransfer) domain-containing protein
VQTNPLQSVSITPLIDTNDSQIELETGTPEEEFEQLRQRFHNRLRKEQTQLAVLTKALARPDVASAQFLVDVREFAHRLRGAALVFGFQKLGDGAKAVELAAIAASLEANEQRRDPSVAATMQELTVRLAEEIGSGTPCPPTMTPSTGPASKPSAW